MGPRIVRTFETEWHDYPFHRAQQIHAPLREIEFPKMLNPSAHHREELQTEIFSNMSIFFEFLNSTLTRFYCLQKKIIVFFYYRMSGLEIGGKFSRRFEVPAARITGFIYLFKSLHTHLHEDMGRLN